jgi:putative FmdB family regulatory protein
MPIYEYRCRNGHEFEVIQSMSDDPVHACEQCGAPVERVFHPVAVHFKGSGFYSTDYAAKAKAGAESKDGDSGGKDSESAKSGDSTGSKASKGGDSGSSKSGGETKAKTGSGSD